MYVYLHVPANERIIQTNAHIYMQVIPNQQKFTSIDVLKYVDSKNDFLVKKSNVRNLSVYSKVKKCRM